MSGIAPAMDATADGGDATLVSAGTPVSATTAAAGVAAAPANATVPALPRTSPTDPASPASNAAATATAPLSPTSAGVPAEAVAQKSATGISFPLRPATTASAQAPSPAVGHASAADAGSIGGALFSLVLVVGLILALGWLARRMPGMQRGGATAQLRVVASVALGPRDRAVVVDVGGTQLLLGVGTGGVRALHTLEHPLPATEAVATSPFAQVLAQHFGKKP